MDVENTKPPSGGFGRRHAGPAGIFGECQKHKNVRNVFGQPQAGCEAIFYMDVENKKSSIKLDYLVPRGGLEPPRREALTPEASVSTNSTTEACVLFVVCDFGA